MSKKASAPASTSSPKMSSKESKAEKPALKAETKAEIPKFFLSDAELLHMWCFFKQMDAKTFNWAVSHPAAVESVLEGKNPKSQGTKRKAETHKAKHPLYPKRPRGQKFVANRILKNENKDIKAKDQTEIYNASKAAAEELAEYQSDDYKGPGFTKEELAERKQMAALYNDSLRIYNEIAPEWKTCCAVFDRLIWKKNPTPEQTKTYTAARDSYMSKLAKWEAGADEDEADEAADDDEPVERPAKRARTTKA